jgi:hypothetical protein
MSLDGDRASLSFDQEIPEGLWIGGRDANTVVLRGSNGMSPDAARYSSLPPGHPQEYQDSATPQQRPSETAGRSVRAFRMILLIFPNGRGLPATAPRPSRARPEAVRHLCW